MVCILAGTGVFTENSALILARMGSLQLKWEWVNMSSVLSEGALVQHSSVAVIREGTETAALLVGSRVFPCLWVLHFSSRFFTYAGSSEKSKMKKPTYPTNKPRNRFSSFLTISAFLHHRNSTKKLYCRKSWGNWEMLETSKRAFLVTFPDGSFVTLTQQLFISKWNNK